MFSLATFGTSGRIMTIAVDPSNSAVFYVDAASGGVWKTVMLGRHREQFGEHRDLLEGAGRRIENSAK
jgi:hypothetical protein